jgi:hypothetical protein
MISSATVPKEKLRMTQAFPFAIALFAVAAPAAAAGEGRIVSLSGTEEISQAQAVFSAIDALSSSAAACRKTTSLTPAECVCRSTDGVVALRSAYDRAVRDHPAWSEPGTTVSWSGKAVNFSAIERALEACR